MPWKTPKGLLIDLDGVLISGGKALPGAAAALERLRADRVPFIIVTNATRINRTAVLARLAAARLPAGANDVFTAPVAAAAWLRAEGLTRCRLLAGEHLREDFAGISITQKDPDCVVVGDLGDKFDYLRLNEAFEHLIDGAVLVALHKNRYWEKDGRLRMDAGGFIAALEYASGKPARIIGKPSADFFRLAARRIGLEPAETAMLGDDCESDVAGAQAAGLSGVLIKTGKYRDELFAASGVRPDRILGSIAELPSLLK
ncbi:MAG: TIGR01458 family HAD-type hydrolase [Elusimicrobiota bacterium]